MSRAEAPERVQVLIVEDDSDQRESLILLLRGYGYRAAGVSNGAEALALLRSEERPCLVLCDMVMPVMDGWEFVRELQRDPSIADIPVGFMSGYQRPKDLSSEQRFFSKPVNVGHLLKMIRATCGEGHVP